MDEYQTPIVSELTQEILELRYLAKDTSGRIIETAKELFYRVANNIALADLRYEGYEFCEQSRRKFYEALTSFQFVPGSPILINAGTPLQQLCSDHMVPIEDSMESIFSALKRAAIIHQNGSGCGFNFSSIRPKLDMVGGRYKVSFGPVAVMKIYEVAFNAIKQSGRRQGANMGVLHCTHPDILDFITCKKDGSLKNFNISVLITDEFMLAVKENKDIDLVNPRTKEATKKIAARTIFDLMCVNAWKYGDPGVVFIDTMNSHRSVFEDFGGVSSCGQSLLTQNEAIPYGHINLSAMVINGDFNQELFRSTIHTGVHFLDNALEMSLYLFPETEMVCKANRKIALGVLGFADLLLKLKIPYQSDAALHLIDTIGSILKEETRKASSLLSQTRGVFLHYDKSIWKAANTPMRNASLTALSPTGTTSLLANASCGIEPLFALTYIMKTAEGNEFIRSHPLFEEAVKEYEPEVIRKVAHFGTAQKVIEIPDDVKQLFMTARDIDSSWHIKIQAHWQEYIDAAISKTINLPRTATVEDVAEIYKQAHDAGCKGITIYRDGSRDDQIIELGREQTKLDSFEK